MAMNTSFLHKTTPNEQKSIEVTLYIAKKLQALKTPIDCHKVLKLLYFADRDHLAKYGRLILDDNYIAMQYGPVLSGLYNLLKEARDGYHPKDFTAKKQYEIEPKRAATMDFISESERECLDHVIQTYGRSSFNKLTDLSHDAAWEAANRNGEISVETIAKTLPNSKELLEHLRDC